MDVKGYSKQTEENIALVNGNKVLEETLLRICDEMRGGGDAFDQRCVSLAYTGFQQAFMWLNRAVFQPKRLTDMEYASGRNAQPGE